MCAWWWTGARWWAAHALRAEAAHARAHVRHLCAPQPAWHAIKGAISVKMPMLYLNYRVFTRTEAGEAQQLVRGCGARAAQAVQAVVVPANGC